MVDQSDEFPCIVVDDVITLLELVHLFQYGQRYDQIILLEIVDRTVIVEDDIGIQHEYFR